MRSFIRFNIETLFIATQNPEHNQANLQIALDVPDRHSLGLFVTKLQSRWWIVRLNSRLKPVTGSNQG